MSKLEDALKRYGAEELVSQLSGQGVTLDDILSGNYTPGELAKVIVQEVDREAFGGDVLNQGLILVLQNDKGSRVHQLYSEEDERELLGDQERYHPTKDLLPLLDISSIAISVDPEGVKVQKTRKKPEGEIKPRSKANRKMDLYDPLLYQLLRQQGDRIAHLAYINPNEELPDEKKAVEGERAIREKFPELEPLFMLGLKKVHTLESWLYDMAQKRVSNLKRKVKSFYASNEGKEFVKKFYEQDFMETARFRAKRKEIVQREALYDLAPEVISWVLGQDIVKRRDADFLLRAVGVGLICAEEYEGRIKKAMGYWGTIANSISEAARINYVIENGLLDNPVDIKDVYYPMLREFCDNRGVYSGRNLSTSLYAMYGLGKLMRTENEPVLSFLLNYQYLIPGRWIVNNYKKLLDTTDEIFQRKKEDFSDIKAQTSPMYIIRALERDQELKDRFTSYTGTSREKVMSNNSIGMILKRFVILEKERYEEYFTVRDRSVYLSEK
ncbi:hypothetical protein HN681_03055 [archaeon]|jgi:hypothetical protein|nr:hypothetical protein [archaeon]MBT3731238.1 hypothetical protein [archaeon]MBT4670008.1 hypothetical protein [archaeon]MBT5287790.1 hypothetical protein [archaeon]MBT7052795.1 hypothetical protein [archaeon]